MSGLFRQEAVDKQGQKLLGDVVIASPLSHTAIAGLITLVITGLMTLMIFGEYARKERVVGFLSPDQGVIRIVSRQAGLIDVVHVDTGDDVQAGDMLFTIELDSLSGDGELVAETLAGQIRNEAKQLRDRRRLVPEQYTLTKERLQQQQKAFVDEADRLEEQIKLQDRVKTIEEGVLERYKSLESSEAASSLEVSNQENRFIQASQTLEKLIDDQGRLRSQAQDLVSQVNLLPIEEKRELGAIDDRLRTIEQRLTQTQSEETLIVEAPIAGRVATIRAQTGQMAGPQMLMMTILPANGKLEAKMLVPTRAAGFIQSGQTVRLLYDAFPYQKFGFYNGTVTEVSRTVVSSKDLDASIPFEGSVFLVTVALDQQNIEANGEPYPLQSGMTLSADIILEDRKIWEWVFEPLIGAIKGEGK